MRLGGVSCVAEGRSRVDVRLIVQVVVCDAPVFSAAASLRRGKRGWVRSEWYMDPLCPAVTGIL